MAEATPSRGASSPASWQLTIDDIHEVASRVSGPERDFLRKLTSLDNPREAMTFARILHYFPSARIVDDDAR